MRVRASVVAVLTVLLSIPLGVPLGVAALTPTTPVAAQSRTPPRTTRSAPAENVVQGIRRSFERRPPEWRTRAQACLHYLDEAEAYHNQGEDYFVQASRARNSPEQSRLVKLGNDAIRERQRLIGEFWACTRRTTAGDEFHSQDPPRRDPEPPHDPGPPLDPEPPTVPPPDRPDETPDIPPRQPPIWQLPPGFPFPPAEARPPRTPRTPATPWIVALGDSMTAGSGLKAQERWPAVLEGMIHAGGARHKVVNAGKDNDTAEGARQRLRPYLVANTKILIVAVGLNDTRRMPQRPIKDIEADLASIIMQAQQRGINVVLCGFSTVSIEETYEIDFRKMYVRLSQTYGVPLVATLNTKIWADPTMNYDHVHPNAKGAQYIAGRVYEKLKPLLGTGTGATGGTRNTTRR